MKQMVINSVNMLIDRFGTKYEEGFLPNEIKIVLDFMDKCDYPIDTKNVEDLLLTNEDKEYITTKNNLRIILIRNIQI